MELSNLKPKKGARHAKKRVGRGPGSGHGKTSGRGEKGQKSRSGYSRMLGFEGGQMPLHRRLPKRGFNNIFREEWCVVNVAKLAKLEGSHFSPAILVELGVVSKLEKGLKVLAMGEITRPITVEAHAFSTEAKKKIEAAGGTATVIFVPPPAPVVKKPKVALGTAAKPKKK